MNDPALLARPIAHGDLVIVDEGDKLVQVYLRAGASLQNRFGTFKHDALVGRPFGHKAHAADKRGGFVHVLAPTPELWSLSLSHRTQILYAADVSLIIARFNLVPGSVVIEAGTGSGSLTTSLVTAVAGAAGGHVYTFEFNEQRAAYAAKEFAANGFGPDVITTAHADVCEPGWSFARAVPVKADAAIFDLPSPWLVVPAALEALRPGGVWCSFSPCIGQIERTAAALAKHRFTSTRTFEVLVRAHDVGAHAARDEAPRGGSRPKARGARTEGAGRKRPREGEPAADAADADADAALADAALAAARAAADAAADAAAADAAEGALRAADERAPRDEGAAVVTMRGGLGSELRGHTGYLLFSTRPLEAQARAPAAAPEAPAAARGDPATTV
jgi:tRNA (adenine57-N1/adenine58-N1)-methyltransferase